MSFPRYPKYKDSGVEWLGAVPEHWDTVQFRYFVEIENGADHKHIEENEGYPVYGSGGIFSYASDFLYDGESVLLGRKGTIDKPIYVTGSFWTVDTMYWTKIKSNTSGRYAYYAATTVPFSYYSTSTALPSMTKGALNGHRVARPPLAEQTAIATFLDRETAKIDGLIAEQRRLMELLKEKRQAVISHAVTKGLNPDAPMKPSGIEWLGDVPEHWQLGRVKYLTKILRGKFTHRPRNDPKMYDGPYPFIQTGEISSESRFVGEYHQTLSEAGFEVSKQFPKGTLVMTITGAGTANVAILNYEACFPDSIVGFVPKESVSIDYLYNLFIAMRAVLLSTSVTNTQPNLNIERIGALMTVNPPLQEQEAILRRIDDVSGAYAEMIHEAQRAIDLLQERHTALISAAVTGQIDVRQLGFGENAA